MISSLNPPPLWEIEFRVFDVVVEQTGIARDAIRSESRLLEDLHIDSLDLVELVLAIEETFDVTIPDDASRLPFVSDAITVGARPVHLRTCCSRGAVSRRMIAAVAISS